MNNYGFEGRVLMTLTSLMYIVQYTCIIFTDKSRWRIEGCITWRRICAIHSIWFCRIVLAIEYQFEWCPFTLGQNASADSIQKGEKMSFIKIELYLMFSGPFYNFESTAWTVRWWWEGRHDGVSKTDNFLYHSKAVQFKFQTGCVRKPKIFWYKFR